MIQNTPSYEDLRFFIFKVAKKISRDRKKSWNSAKLHKLYLDDNYIFMSAEPSFRNLNYFNEDVIPFNSIIEDNCGRLFLKIMQWW